MTLTDYLSALIWIAMAVYFGARMYLWPIMQEDLEWERLMVKMEARTDRGYYGE